MCCSKNTGCCRNQCLPLGFFVGSIAGVLLLTVHSWFLTKEGLPRDPKEILEISRHALSAGRFDESEAMALSVPSENHLSSAALMIAGESATRRGIPEKAIGYYQKVPEDSSDFGSAVYALGELYRSTCCWDEAIEYYRKALKLNPGDLDCKERLAFLLGASGQPWETIPLFMDLVRSGRWSVESLAIFGDIERPIEQLDLVTECFLENRSDPVVQLARASHHLIDGQLRAARAILEPLVHSEPQILSAQVQLGEVYLGLNEFGNMLRWNQQLPESAEESPQVWYLRGRLARNLEQFELAAGCFTKALQIVPEHRQATYQLGQVLSKLGNENAGAVVQRAEIQAELGQQFDKALTSQGADQAVLKKTAELCFDLGRFLEAQAWAQTSLQTNGQSEWGVSIIQKTEKVLLRSSPRTLTEHQPIQKFSLSSYLSLASKSNLNKLAEHLPVEVASGSARPSIMSQVHFDLAKNCGLDFTYFNGQDPSTVGARMFEQTGGGVGVIDYDNDGLPDLYLTQGTVWKTGDLEPTLSPEYSDALFRNLNGTGFKEVSAQAGIIELEFGQGIAAGDLNHDGFDDLLVSNVGRCRLFLNCGDGTFMESTQSLIDQTPAWGTSCCIVDLNLDGLPDIYKLNYVQGKDVYTLICNGKGCSPSVFDGSPNQCWLNAGDGSYLPMKDADGDPKSSKSLGVVAFKLTGERFPSLFVANDQVRNFLMHIEASKDGLIQLSDESLLRGVALNADGLPLASMGIAADDIDNNGTVDLLVTNFANEANSIYLQDASGFFTDIIGSSAMLTASYPYVGWGTQFLDANRDSLPDVIVVNGHVDDYSDKGQGYEMAAQFFLNTGNNQFALQAPEKVGDYFQQPRLGRSAARLDWNRDGLMDFVVSNMNSATTLATNTTQNPGSYLNLQLVGTRSARHPVGATVKVTTDIGSWEKQILSGDGYQCCNQKMTQFGLGRSSLVREVAVIWPDDSTTQISQLDLNSTWLIIQDCDLPHRLIP